MTVRFVEACKLPNRFGVFTLHGFEDTATGIEHLAITHGDIADGIASAGPHPLECLTGDSLFSERCDCGYQLEAAMRQIVDEGRRVILYLRQEGRIGLLNKIAPTNCRTRAPTRWRPMSSSAFRPTCAILASVSRCWRTGREVTALDDRTTRASSRACVSMA